MLKLVMAALAVLALTVASCAGGNDETAAPAPAEPAPVAQPAPTVPAMDPKPSSDAMMKETSAMAMPEAVNPTEPGQIIGAYGKPGAKTLLIGGGTPKSGGIGTFGVRRDPPAGFDMMMTTIWYDLHQIGSPIWGSGSLVRPCLNDVYAVCAGVATEWESNDDFTQWTFTMREGVTWHDGTPVTAEGMKFWLDLVFTGAKSGDKVRRPAWYATTMGKFDSVEVLDGNKVRINLLEPNSHFLEVLFTPYFTVAHPQHIMQPKIDSGVVDSSPLELGMPGFGPFMYDGYEKGSIARVRKYDGYWEKDGDGTALPYMDGMDFAIMQSPQAMDAAIRVGRLDGGSPGFGYILTGERYKAYKNDLGDKFWAAQVPSGFSTGSGSGLAFNLLKEGPWQDVRVRKAMALWIDKQQAVEAVTGGFGIIGGLFNPSNPFTSPDVLTWPGWNADTKEQDRARAKELMAEAGYADGGFTMSYNCLTTGAWRDRCEFLNAQLAGLGIDLKLDLMDAPAWKAAGTSLKYGAVQSAGGITSRIPEANEPGFTLHSISPTAFVKHEDPKIPEFFQRMRASSSLDERIKVWRELERYWLLDEVYGVPLVGNLATIPYRSWVKGRLLGPEQIMAYMDFTTVWLDK